RGPAGVQPRGRGGPGRRGGWAGGGRAHRRGARRVIPRRAAPPGGCRHRRVAFRCPPMTRAQPGRGTVMRKIVFMMSVSLDGFFEGPDRELDWQLVDVELHQHFNEWLAKAGAFLDGRVTYELMAGYWPTADQDPGASAPVIEFARIWR